jgi:hypothetical protein
VLSESQAPYPISPYDDWQTLPVAKNELGFTAVSLEEGLGILAQHK